MANRGPKVMQPHHGDQRLYDDYYSSQQMGHGLPVFVGSRMQRGYGLGNLFSGLARAAFPLVKSGVKAIGKQGFKTGMQILGDVMSGQKPKQAAKRRAKQAGTQLVSKGLRKVQHRPGAPARTVGRGQLQRRGIKRRAPSHRGRVSQSKRARDIFG